MVRRGARNGRDDGKPRTPVISTVELDSGQAEEGALEIHSARRMNPRQLKFAYPDGFGGCYLIRSSADRQIAFESVSIIYLAYGMGLIEPDRDILVVDGDRDGRLSTALIHHGATLLHDDAAMAGENAQFDSSTPLEFDTVVCSSSFVVTPDRKIRYFGSITGRLLPALVYSELDSAMHIIVEGCARKIELIYASAGIPVVLRDKLGQTLYAMTMSRLGGESADICRELGRYRAMDAPLVREVSRLISLPSYQDSSLYKDVMAHQAEFTAVCRIWDSMMRGFDGREARMAAAADAQRLVEEQPELISAAMLQWPEEGDAEMKRSMELTCAMGLARGVDVALDALAAGIELEDILTGFAR